MCKIKRKIIDWNPGYCDVWKGQIYYERSWFCNENKIIHHSTKELMNCKHCISEHDKNEYKLFKIEHEALMRLEFFIENYFKYNLNHLYSKSATEEICELYNVKIKYFRPFL